MPSAVVSEEVRLPRKLRHLMRLSGDDVRGWVNLVVLLCLAALIICLAWLYSQEEAERVAVLAFGVGLLLG
jgi:hypothetical protein